MCDADSKIIAICCRFGGAASNAYIWNKMNIRPYVEEIYRQGEPGWIIGKGYMQIRFHNTLTCTLYWKS